MPRKWSTARNRRKSTNKKIKTLFRGNGEVSQTEKDFLIKDAKRIFNITRLGKSRRSLNKAN